MPGKFHYWRLIGCILTILSIFVSSPAFSTEGAALLPGSVDAGRIGNELNVPTASKAGGAAIFPGFKPTAPTSQAQQIQFKLTHLVIVGSTVYGNARLESMFQNYVGHTISLADLQKMADTITLKYRNDGYILSKAVIPAQQISNGTATIRVIEGYINQVYVTGNPKGARKLLQEYGDQLKKYRPLNISTLERYALLANDIPGIDVKTVLAPAAPPTNVIASNAITPGGVDLTFVAAEHTANGYFSYDNRGTRYLGPHEYTISGNVNSVFRSGDQTGIQALTTTDFQELTYINVYHQTPIGSDGTEFNIGGSYTHTFPGYILRPLGTIGLSKSFTTGLTYPLIRGRTQSLFLNGKFDYLNNRTNLTQFSLILFNDHIRSLRFGADYNLNDRWFGANDLGTQISQGLHAFGASNNDSNTLSRPDAVSDYTKMNFNASRLQAFPHNVSLLVSGQGQYAFNPLLSAEQFGYGGAQYGQAYDPSEILGDHGIEGKAELRYNQFIEWRALQGVQYFTFYDIGKIWNREAAESGQLASASGASTGFGVRTNFTRFVSGTLEYAIPLTRNVATQGNRQPRIFFSISLAGDTPASFGTTTVNDPVPVPAATTQNYSGLQQTQQIIKHTTDTPTTTATHTASTHADSQITPTKYAWATIPKTVPITQGVPSTSPKSRYVGLTETSVSPMYAQRDNQSNYNQQTMRNDTAHIKNDYYTVQLLGSRNLSDLQRYANKENLRDHINYLHVPLDGENWYILTYGQYPSARAAALAEAEMAHMPEKPWIRHIAPGTPLA